MEDKSPEDQKGILEKSFDLWKRMAVAGPKMVMETIKDPKAGVEHLQEQVQEQVKEVGDMLNARLDADAWKPASKSDMKNLMQAISRLSGEVNQLNKKVEGLASKVKSKKS